MEAVRRESRVAWALLRNASVLSLEGGILTLRFPSVGEMKGFSVSGHDAVLKRVLSADFGLNVTVKGVTGADPGAGPARPPAGHAPARVRAGRSRAAVWPVGADRSQRPGPVPAAPRRAAGR